VRDRYGSLFHSDKKQCKPCRLCRELNLEISVQINLRQLGLVLSSYPDPWEFLQVFVKDFPGHDALLGMDGECHYDYWQKASFEHCLFAKRSLKERNRPDDYLS